MVDKIRVFYGLISRVKNIVSRKYLASDRLFSGKKPANKVVNVLITVKIL